MRREPPPVQGHAERVEWLLSKTIEAGRASGAVTDKSLKRIAVDTTVMEKNIAHPTDARLYERARTLLVGLAKEAGIELRQSYARLAPRLAVQVGRYAHARQFKRMRKALRQLKGYPGRIRRDLRRHLQDIPEGALREKVLEALWPAGRLLEQTPNSKDKIYSLHQHELDCISKGKARVRYEFGTKVSLATTIEEGFVVGARSFPGNPYDGHALAPALEQVAILTDQVPDLAVVDRGYRGHGVNSTKVLNSGMRRGLTPLLARLLKRRSAIEPEIGHMKMDGRLARCPLKGRIGDGAYLGARKQLAVSPANRMTSGSLRKAAGRFPVAASCSQPGQDAARCKRGIVIGIAPVKGSLPPAVSRFEGRKGVHTPLPFASIESSAIPAPRSMALHPDRQAC